MHLFLSILVTALIVPLAAHAQAIKRVEVINVPLAVEVVKSAPPSACPVLTWQFVGDSTQAVNGRVGIIERNRVCESAFVGSRQCTSKEIIETPNLVVSTDDAWVWPHFVQAASSLVVDFSGVVSGVEAFTCWSGQSGLARVGDSFALNPCTRIDPVACCALMP